MQIRLSGSNIRLATCEMAAQIHFHARHLHVFSGRKGDEPCQPPLGPRYPINPGLTCGVLGSRTRKVEKCPTIQRRSIEEGAISGNELVERWELVNGFHASTLLLFLGNGSELLKKLILSDPYPLRWTVESKRENTRQHFFFFFLPPDSWDD